MSKNYVIEDERTTNIKLYPLYKSISWDAIFYYTIIFLFLTQIKGYSASAVLLSSSIFSIVMMIMQIPAARITEKFGKRNTLIVRKYICCT